MRKLLSALVWGGAVSFAAAIGLAASAGAVTISGPLTAAQLSALNGSGAAYGPPAPAHFTEPGPITVDSGSPSTLFAGPSAHGMGSAAASTALLVLSAAPADVATLGSITLTFDALPSVTFSASDFFTTAAAGFPSSIGGIANGAVNGIKFPGSEHAAVDLDFGALISTLFATDAPIDSVTITTPINLRVDVFGDNLGLIVNNAANSGALGVQCVAGGPIPCTGSPVVPTPEPNALALVGGALALFGLLWRRRHSL
jgi:PEP-CTERM motif